jgi:TolA-binding protein
MPTRWVPLQVTVPEQSIPELNNFVASLAQQAIEQKNQTVETREDAVRRALKVSTGSGWALIRTIAQLSQASADGWVTWQALADAMSMDTAGLAGVLGGFEKKTKDIAVLVERGRAGNEVHYRMDNETARIVFAVAAERTAESLRVAGENAAGEPPTSRG